MTLWMVVGARQLVWVFPPTVDPLGSTRSLTFQFSKALNTTLAKPQSKLVAVVLEHQQLPCL